MWKRIILYTLLVSLLGVWTACTSPGSGKDEEPATTEMAKEQGSTEPAAEPPAADVAAEPVNDQGGTTEPGLEPGAPPEPVDETAPVDSGSEPAPDTTVDNGPVDTGPADNTPVDNTPVDNTPSDNTPADTGTPEMAMDAGSEPGVADQTAGEEPQLSCAELVQALKDELKSIQSCTSDAECGQTLPGTSCGCTRNLVAKKNADSTRFFKLLSEARQRQCPDTPSFVSTCDCPATYGYECKSGSCAWKYSP